MRKVLKFKSKKSVLLFVIILLLVIGIVLVICSEIYYRNDGFDQPYYVITDTDYLGKNFDKTELDTDTEKELYDLCSELITISFQNDGTDIPTEYTDVISSKLFERLDVGINYDNRLYDENFQLKDITVKCNKSIDKAIAEYTFAYSVTSKEDGTVFCSFIVMEDYPCKIYLTKNNDTWIVDDVFITN
jgi:uncharacterized protein YxeA